MKRGSFDSNICTSDVDCDPDPDFECTSSNPEHCSVCVPGQPGPNGTTVSKCMCRGASQCSLCSAGTHFFLEGKCETCPDNPALLVALLVVGAIGACVGGYVLGQKKFNMAFLSIGVDYLQVLALFAGSNIRWPGWMKRVFQMLSIFNFNIDIAAPECIVPELPFGEKWAAMMLLPVFSGLVLFLVWGGKVVYKMFCFHQTTWKKLNKHGSRIIATFTLLYYYMYLSLTRTAIRVFNCNPIIPPEGESDGYLYTDFNDLSCGGGRCRCGEGLQADLVFPAILGLIVYSVGYPVLILYVIRGNKEKIKEDQLLRAAGVGDTRQSSTSDDVYNVRKRWHKLYYHFKPGKTYWIFLIVNRKLWIAVAGLMFRGTPGFQLAFVLMILFISYVLQVQHRPYMSSAERALVIEDHEKKAQSNDEFHKRVQPLLKNAVHLLHKKREAARRKLRKKKVEQLSGQIVGSRAPRKTQEAEELLHADAKEYFWDYNTIEATLLACAIFVCLSGVMFESSYFSGRDDLLWQRDIIMYAVMIVLIYSMVYYLVVFTSEVLGQSPAWLQKMFASKKKGGFVRGSKKHSSIDDAQMAYSATRLFDPNAKLKQEQKLKETRLQLEEAQKQNIELATMVKTKHAEARSNTNPLFDKTVKSRGNRGKVKRKKQKTEFVSNPMVLSGKSQDIEMTVQPVISQSTAAKIPTAAPPPALPPGWNAHVDPSTGATYYSDSATGAVSWTPPNLHKGSV